MTVFFLSSLFSYLVLLTPGNQLLFRYYDIFCRDIMIWLDHKASWTYVTPNLIHHPVRTWYKHDIKHMISKWYHIEITHWSQIDIILRYQFFDIRMISWWYHMISNLCQEDIRLSDIRELYQPEIRVWFQFDINLRSSLISAWYHHDITFPTGIKAIDTLRAEVLVENKVEVFGRQFSTET